MKKRGTGSEHENRKSLHFHGGDDEHIHNPENAKQGAGGHHFLLDY
ncbi:hypothetical protein [Paenibacillus sp. RC343]|nr:hypothetical protein [Paenibacillus sp. RC343]